MTHQPRSSIHQAEPAPTPDPVAALRGVLGQLEQLIATLDREMYARKPVGTFGGSVGGHVRHCLDHVEALLRGSNEGLIDYDRRERGTVVEQDDEVAIEQIEQLDQRLALIHGAPTDAPLDVALMLSGQGPSLRWKSTLGRELAFVLSHTIHHGAMIGAMVRTMGGQVPEDFGLAPSTIAASSRS